VTADNQRKETVTDCLFATVNLQMLMALYAHREFHDLRARDVGVERCSCELCLNDDAAIQAALKMESRYEPIVQPVVADVHTIRFEPTNLRIMSPVMPVADKEDNRLSSAKSGQRTAKSATPAQPKAHDSAEAICWSWSVKRRS
jgi:hypothetical protein